MFLLASINYRLRSLSCFESLTNSPSSNHCNLRLLSPLHVDQICQTLPISQDHHIYFRINSISFSTSLRKHFSNVLIPEISLHKLFLWEWYLIVFKITIIGSKTTTRKISWNGSVQYIHIWYEKTHNIFSQMPGNWGAAHSRNVTLIPIQTSAKSASLILWAHYRNVPTPKTSREATSFVGGYTINKQTS